MLLRAILLIIVNNVVLPNTRSLAQASNPKERPTPCPVSSSQDENATDDCQSGFFRYFLQRDIDLQTLQSKNDRPINLHRTDPIEVWTKSDQIVKRLGKNVTMICHFPIDTYGTINWRFNGEDLDINDDRYDFFGTYKNFPTLMIKRISMDDMGNYSCYLDAGYNLSEDPTEYQISVLKGCSHMMYGETCERKCGPCARNKTCDEVTGKCRRCKVGHVMPYCDKEKLQPLKDKVALGVGIGAPAILGFVVGALQLIKCLVGGDMFGGDDEDEDEEQEQAAVVAIAASQGLIPTVEIVLKEPSSPVSPVSPASPASPSSVASVASD